MADEWSLLGILFDEVLLCVIFPSQNIFANIGTGFYSGAGLSKNVLTNKTPVLTRSINTDIWVISTLNQLFDKSFLDWN